MFLLYLTHPTGRVELRTFYTRFDRALTMIALASAGCTLRPVDY